MLESFSKVIERNNRLLRNQKKAQSDLLDNMRQAVFAVDSKGRIVKPISKHSSVLFGADIVGQRLVNLLGPMTDDERYNVESSIELLFMGDALQWKMAVCELPTRIVQTRGQKNSQLILRFSYAPIWASDAEEEVDRILVVAEDITEVESLEKQATAARAQRLADLETAESLVAAERAVVSDFFLQADELMAVAATAECSTPDGMRALHTIKGNARSLSLRLVVSAAHAAETAVCRDEVLDEPLRELKAQLENVRQLADRFFGIDRRGNDAAVDQNHMKAIEEALRSDDAAALVLEAQKLVCCPLHSSWAGMAGMVEDLARSESKQITFEAKPIETEVSRRWAQSLRGVLNHLVRNAVGHGIEDPEERRQAGKTAGGTIRIRATQNDAGLDIEVEDDGRGLNADALRASAGRVFGNESRTPAGHDELLYLATLPGVSTAEVTTDLSGRGVGLDAVRTEVAAWGGTLQVISEPNHMTTFRLTVPWRTAVPHPGHVF